MTPINLEDVESYILKRVEETLPISYRAGLKIRLQRWFAELRAREEAKTHVK